MSSQNSQFTQEKLSAAEWKNIEQPLTDSEKEICELISRGFDDPLVRINKTPTIQSFTKMQSTEELEKRFFSELFSLQMEDIQKKIAKALKPKGKLLAEKSSSTSILQRFSLRMKEIADSVGLSGRTGGSSKEKGKILKKADLIRLNHTCANLSANKLCILEFLLFDQIEAIVQSICNQDTKSTANAVYTLTHMAKDTSLQRNRWVQSLAEVAVCSGQEFLGGEREVAKLVLTHAGEIIESNRVIRSCADVQLYQHQKELFSAFRSSEGGPKLVFYRAATGTGKTLSPLGLSTRFKVIFVCAARHIGLALARSAIAVDKAVAFAFGCESPADIRLHYFAAKEYTLNRRSGGIGKVDNEVGDRVQIMICDIKSYQYAMRYMLAFNPVENMVTYWDEPTISLDHETHYLHEKIQELWTINKIPRVVLSSATLPDSREISSVVSDFQTRFSGAEVVSIVSNDGDRSVSLISKSGVLVTPHTMFLEESEYPVFRDCITHCKNNPILLKFFDLGQVSNFLIMAIDDRLGMLEKDLIAEVCTVEKLTIGNIKQVYLEFLHRIPAEKWSACLECFRPLTQTDKGTRPELPSVYFTTKDAYSLTNGPSIFVVEDVYKVAQFLLQESQIPGEKVEKLQESIDFNEKQNDICDKLRRKLDDLLASELTKERKQTKETERMSPAVRQLTTQLESGLGQIKQVTLEKRFLPNTRAHQSTWAPDGVFNPESFTANLDPSHIEIVMNLSVENCWKILLLMGIGVFPKEGDNQGGLDAVSLRDYLEAMKLFATEERLFLIIASSDYIFGLNYNFCHGILGKDLGNMSQQKAIQTAGRVGRFNDSHKYSLRLRDDALIDTLFLQQASSIEALNFNKLFRISQL
jgi:hypothetical protein